MTVFENEFQRVD